MCSDGHAQCSTLRFAGRERKTRFSALSAAKVKGVSASTTAAVPAHELDFSGAVDCNGADSTATAGDAVDDNIA